MKNGESKVENLNTRAFQPHREICGLRSAFSAPGFFAIMIGLLAFASPIIAAEIVAETATESGTHLFWLAKWFLILPVVILIGLSLIVNKRQGWGWVIVGLMILFALMIMQVIWSIITSIAGDTANDENYFTPIDKWTSDSFDD